MKSEARMLVLVIGAAACGGRATPPARPAPATRVAASSPSVTSKPAAVPSDSISRVEFAIPDSVLTKQVAAVFGDSIISNPPETAVPEGPTWDIDVRSYEAHRRVEFYVAAFTGSARDRFISRLEKGSRYEPMIREKLRAGKIPEDMYYLALVESGFDQHAYSRAAAVGMWQFMTATARGTGLRVDWWVDERRDPVRSTDAAVKFLGWLREQFGSLYLAAAAYNGGPGRVSRGLSRLGDESRRRDGRRCVLRAGRARLSPGRNEELRSAVDRRGARCEGAREIRNEAPHRAPARLRLRVRACLHTAGRDRGCERCVPGFDSRAQSTGPARRDAARRAIPRASAGRSRRGLRQRVRGARSCRA